MKYRLPFVVCLALSALCQTSCKKDNSDKQDYEPVTVHSEWFEVDYLGDRIYCIEEPKSSQGNVSYLILGDSRAIMFDTGCGENEEVQGSRIKHIIDQITSLPVTLIQSHFHFDHNQNIHEFERIGFPDLTALRDRVSEEGLFRFTLEDLFEGDYLSEITVDVWFPMETDIDLGGRVIQ